MCYPVQNNIINKAEGVHLSQCTTEWLRTLSEEDKKTVDDLKGLEPSFDAATSHLQFSLGNTQMELEALAVLEVTLSDAQKSHLRKVLASKDRLLNALVWAERNLNINNKVWRDEIMPVIRLEHEDYCKRHGIENIRRTKRRVRY
jgi:hypothetical protein